MKTSIKIQRLTKKLEVAEANHDALINRVNKVEDGYTDAIHKQNVALVDEVHSLRNEIRELGKIPEVGKYANKFGYSDAYPFEIVKVISDKTLEIRAMNYELSEDWKPAIEVGGFSGHCTNNNTQTYNYTSDPEAVVIRIRKKKDRDEWTHNGERYLIDAKPYRHYDYNF